MQYQNFDDIELEDLLEWMESGKETMPPEIVAYALMLERIWGMYRRNFDFPNQDNSFEFEQNPIYEQILYFLNRQPFREKKSRYI